MDENWVSKDKAQHVEFVVGEAQQIYFKNKGSDVPQEVLQNDAPSCSGILTGSRDPKPKDKSKQLDIRKFFKCKESKMIKEPSKESLENTSCDFVAVKKNLAHNVCVFEKKGKLSPHKLNVESNFSKEEFNLIKRDHLQPPIKTSIKNRIDLLTTVKTGLQGDSDTSKIKDSRHELGLVTPSKATETTISMEHAFSQIKYELTRSAKLNLLKKTLLEFKKKSTKLDELECSRKQLDAKGPQLQKFKRIEIEAPVSPQMFANTLQSPLKRGYPLRSPIKSPAYKKYPTLALLETCPVVLPPKYYALFATFLSLDTIVAMFFNRREVITFKKAKPAVQELLGRNFTEFQLGQIHTLYPNAYTFKQEKHKTFGSTSKTDKYELVILPVLDHEEAGDNPDTQECGYLTLTPNLILSRKYTFRDLLMKKAMKHHAEFLQGLDPPLTVPNDKLTHWHPNFDLERIVDIEASELPQPPNIVNTCHAQDLLDRALPLISCNQRMEMALKSTSEKMKKGENPSTGTIVSEKNKPPVQDIFKGVPKGILEKVRAKQAAKFLQIMTISPKEEKECLQYARLPEFARIIRNTYITEKKAVLSMYSVTEKLRDSYCENLTREELEEHVTLLCAAVPGWLTSLFVRGQTYLRFAREGDMAKVMEKLESLAVQKSTF